MYKKHIFLKTISLLVFYVWMAPVQHLATNRLSYLGNLVKRNAIYPTTHKLSKESSLATHRAMCAMSHRRQTLSYLSMAKTTGRLHSDICCFNGQNRHINVSANSGRKQAALFLKELEEMLEEVKEHLDVAEGQNCIVFMGTTGVGKSLLVNAIYHGSDTIEAVKKDVKYSFSSPSDGDVHLIPTKKVLRKDQILFNTGAGNRSVTFFPEAVALDGQVLVDCPGFGDTRGGIHDLINCIAIAKILHRATRVRLCFLLSQNQIMRKAGRQKATKELLEVLLRLFKAEEFSGISSDDLKKVQIVVTHLAGNKKKGDLQNKLAETLDQLLNGEKPEAVRQLVEHILLVDPADRLSQFKDVKRSWLWYSSNDQTTVAALKRKLFDVEDDMWLVPSTFATPMTHEAVRALAKMSQAIKDEAISAIYSDSNYEERVAALLRPLKKLQKYHFEGIKVDRYITEINRALEARKAGKKKEKTIEELRKSMEKAKKELNNEAKEKGFFAKKIITQLAWFMIDPVVRELVHYIFKED